MHEEYPSPFHPLGPIRPGAFLELRKSYASSRQLPLVREDGFRYLADGRVFKDHQAETTYFVDQNPNEKLPR